MRSVVCAAVMEICDDKREAGIYPAGASLLEISKIIREETDKALSELEEDGILTSHLNFNQNKIYQYNPERARK